jgi:hypothetical protein
VAFSVAGLGETEECELFGCATAAEADGHAAPGQHVCDRYLFSDIKGMMEVKTNDRRAKTYFPGLTGQVQGKEQGRRQMAMMDVGVVLGKPRVLYAELVG